MNNENENENVTDSTTDTDQTTDIATRNAAAIQNHSPVSGEGFDLTALPASEQLEIVREIYDAEAQLEAMALPQYKSSDILNRPINVLDAAFRTIKDGETDKVCVSFVCEFQDTGEQFTCLKGSNAFNDVYANRFTKLRGIMQRPLNGYEFVTDSRYNKAGNDAIVLRRISPALAKSAKK